MQLVLNALLTSYCLSKSLGIDRQTEQIVACLTGSLILDLSLRLDTPNCAQLCPVLSPYQVFSLSHDPITTSFYPTMPLVLRLVKVVFNATKLLLTSLVKQLHDSFIQIALIALER